MVFRLNHVKLLFLWHMYQSFSHCGASCQQCDTTASGSAQVELTRELKCSRAEVCSLPIQSLMRTQFGFQNTWDVFMPQIKKVITTWILTWKNSEWQRNGMNQFAGLAVLEANTGGLKDRNSGSKTVKQRRMALVL